MPLLHLMMTFINAHAWWVTYTRRWWQNHWPWVTTRSICKSHLLPMNVHLEHPKATHQHCQVLHILTWCFSSLLYFWLFLDMSCCCHASNRLSMLFSEFALKWSSPTTMWGTFPIMTVHDVRIVIHLSKKFLIWKFLKRARWLSLTYMGSWTLLMHS